MIRVRAIDNSSNLKDVLAKANKLGNLWDKGEIGASLIHYIPSLVDVSRQGQIYSIISKKAYTSNAYVDQKILEFNVILATNTYTNYSMTSVVLLVQFTRKRRYLKSR